MRPMKDETAAVFKTLRVAVEFWSEAAGHRDAYVRGTQARRDIAAQIRSYKFMWGRAKFIETLRTNQAKEMSELLCETSVASPKSPRYTGLRRLCGSGGTAHLLARSS